MLEYIQDSMPEESAGAFGLHPNAEVGFKMREAVLFCNNLLRLQASNHKLVMYRYANADSA